jgi:hypothetical protein
MRTRFLDLNLHFHFHQNQTDVHVIVGWKEDFNSSKKVFRSSVILAYSYFYTGTGDDKCYGNNSIWFSNCREWIQFLTIADVGAIHLGHLQDALFIFSPFLFPFAQLNKNNDCQALSFYSQCTVPGGWESFLGTAKRGTSHPSNSSENRDLLILHLFWFFHLWCESLLDIWADTIELWRMMTSDWKFSPCRPNIGFDGMPNTFTKKGD